MSARILTAALAAFPLRRPPSNFPRSFSATSCSDSIPVSLSLHQRHQVARFVEVLLDWNERMNLTAVTDEGEVMERHVHDSLALLPPLDKVYFARSVEPRSEAAGVDVVDVGSGAGLPGIVLAIARPRWRFTLLESMRKRCTFLEHAIEAAGLSNVQVLCDRAEDRMLGEALIIERFMMLLWQELSRN